MEGQVVQQETDLGVVFQEDSHRGQSATISRHKEEGDATRYMETDKTH